MKNRKKTHKKMTITTITSRECQYVNT